MSFPQSLSGNPLWRVYRFPIKSFGNDKRTIIAQNWYDSIHQGDHKAGKTG
jgi:hypothetical protein